MKHLSDLATLEFKLSSNRGMCPTTYIIETTISIFISHPHTLAKSPNYTHTHAHTHSLSLSNTDKHTHSLSHTHTHTHTLTHIVDH